MPRRLIHPTIEFEGTTWKSCGADTSLRTRSSNHTTMIPNALKKFCGVVSRLMRDARQCKCEELAFEESVLAESKRHTILSIIVFESAQQSADDYRWKVSNLHWGFDELNGAVVANIFYCEC
jgi:hypothetical protein